MKRSPMGHGPHYQLMVELAYSRGEPIEMYSQAREKWVSIDAPNFWWGTFDYRIAEPKDLKCEHGNLYYCGLCEAEKAPKCEHGNPPYCGFCGVVPEPEPEDVFDDGPFNEPEDPAAAHRAEVELAAARGENIEGQNLRTNRKDRWFPINRRKGSSDLCWDLFTYRVAPKPEAPLSAYQQYVEYMHSLGAKIQMHDNLILNWTQRDVGGHPFEWEHMIYRVDPDDPTRLDLDPHARDLLQRAFEEGHGIEYRVFSNLSWNNAVTPTWHWNLTQFRIADDDTAPAVPAPKIEVEDRDPCGEVHPTNLPKTPLPNAAFIAEEMRKIAKLNPCHFSPEDRRYGLMTDEEQRLMPRVLVELAHKLGDTIECSFYDSNHWTVPDLPGWAWEALSYRVKDLTVKRYCMLVELAYKNGVKTEHTKKGSMEWINYSTPVWQWDDYEYRIAEPCLKADEAYANPPTPPEPEEEEVELWIHLYRRERPNGTSYLDGYAYSDEVLAEQCRTPTTLNVTKSVKVMVKK